MRGLTIAVPLYASVLSTQEIAKVLRITRPAGHGFLCIIEYIAFKRPYIGRSSVQEIGVVRTPQTFPPIHSSHIFVLLVIVKWATVQQRQGRVLIC